MNATTNISRAAIDLRNRINGLKGYILEQYHSKDSVFNRMTGFSIICPITASFIQACEVLKIRPEIVVNEVFNQDFEGGSVAYDAVVDTEFTSTITITFKGTVPEAGAILLSFGEAYKNAVLRFILNGEEKDIQINLGYEKIIPDELIVALGDLLISEGWTDVEFDRLDNSFKAKPNLK